MRYLIARFIQGVITLFGVTLVTFFLPAFNFSAYSLAAKINGPRSTREENLAWIHQQGLDKPLLAQYWHWLTQALHGNFGISYGVTQLHHTITVNTVLSGAIPRSIWLVLVPTVLSIMIAIPIGLTQAIRRNHIYDHAMTTVVYVLYSTPVVLVCVLLQYYGGVKAGIGLANVSSTAVEVPTGQFPNWLIHHLDNFILPWLAIIVLSVGGLTRFMRGSALDTLVQDHVRTARAKGASSTRVLFRHVLRPSLIPMITIIGLTIPAIIGGALIVESVFNYPGMGILAVSSVSNEDFTTVMAITLVTAILTIVGNFLADVFVAVADPRVRLGGQR